MSTLRLPNFWRGMSFTAKAAYLCSSRQATDFSHACSLLAKMKRRPVARTVPTPPQNIRLPYAD